MKTLSEALKILEIEDYPKLKTSMSVPQARKVLAEIHDLVRAQRRVLARKYHPDTGGSAERMKEINMIADEILKLQIRPRPTPVFYYTYYSTAGYTDTTTTTGWG